MRLLIIILALLTAGCAGVYSYDASIQGPNGRYDIVGRRGAIIEGTFPDGSHIKADDRGHPDQPGAFSQALSAAILGVTAD